MASKKDYPRSVRLSTQLQAELSAVLRGELLHDPRVSGVNFSVTRVEVTRDMGHAAVMVSSLFADDEQLAQAVKGLNHAAGRIRHEVGTRVKLRYVPTFQFYPDNALREGDRIGTLISKVVAEDKKQQAERAAAQPAKPTPDLESP
jgi:ribosome-binding factor A